MRGMDQCQSAARDRMRAPAHRLSLPPRGPRAVITVSTGGEGEIYFATTEIYFATPTVFQRGGEIYFAATTNPGGGGEIYFATPTNLNRNRLYKLAFASEMSLGSTN